MVSPDASRKKEQVIFHWLMGSVMVVNNFQASGCEKGIRLTGFL